MFNRNKNHQRIRRFNKISNNLKSRNSKIRRKRKAKIIKVIKAMETCALLKKLLSTSKFQTKKWSPRKSREVSKNQQKKKPKNLNQKIELIKVY